MHLRNEILYGFSPYEYNMDICIYESIEKIGKYSFEIISEIENVPYFSDID